MKNRIQTTAIALLLCMFTFFTKAQSQTVNVSLTPPAEVGACRQNLYTVTFSGAPSGTLLRIVPSLSGTANSFCTTTDGTALQLVSATNAILVSDGDTLVMSINNNGNTTISYMALIDCHIAGSSSIDLNQTFLNYNGLSFLVDNDNIHTTSNLQKPDLVLQNTTGFNAYYLTPSFFDFYYRNNGDSANIRFGFTPGATAFCGQVASDSIFYQKGINGTLYPYTATDADTLQLAHLDTLIIKQRVSINACLTNCANDTAMLWWQCNYTMPQAAAFCSQCGKENYSYTVNNHDSAGIDVIRLLPSRADREFSCFNDTLNAQQWYYMIVNKGKGALDSLNFDLTEWGTSGNPGLSNYLTLIDSASFSLTKGVNSICTISSQMTTRVQWLCKNLVPTAMFNNQIRIKNFGQHDTVYLSFTTLRCSEENDVLLNTPKLYNQWLFKNMRTKNTCGTQTNIYSASGLFGNFISGQMIGTAFDDIDLKLQYFPSVSNLSVDNNGNGDSAVFAVQMKGLVRNSAVNIYQLLGCDTLQNFCDTLHGWLRATVFCDTNIRITRPWQDAFFIKITGGDTTFFNPEYYYTSDTIGYSICRRTTNYFYFNLAEGGMRNVLDSGNFVFKIQACCGSDLSPSPYSVTFHLLPNPDNCFTLQYTGNNFAGHLTPPVINNNSGQVQWLPLSDKRKELFTLCPGCISPGIIAHSYKMQRTASSMGLQDSDNDGRADFPPIQITDTSGWFAQHTSQINRNLSSFGDKVEDFLLANFVDGDRTNGGYDYGQLQQLGLRFNVLQLSRFIPLALDTMQLTVDSLVFYIDDTLGNGTCIDCNTFASGNGYSTLLKINAGPADVSKFLTGTSVADNEYRYAFTSFLNGSTLSGTLHDYPTLITYTNNAFAGFMPSQHYRLHVFYNVCGNFNPVASQNIDDYVKPSQILNRFFFSGKVHHTVSHNIPQQPNSVAELDSAGWTVDSNDVSNMLVDTAFMNTYAFFCEATGAQHYFAGTTYKNQSNTVNKQGCKKLLQLSASSSIAGGKGMYDAYPYEYKPPMLMPVNFKVNIPLGYYAAGGATVQNLVFLNGINTDCLSDTVALSLTDTLGNFNISYADMPALQCMMQHNSPAGNDTLFYGDQYNSRSVNITLLPLPQWCIDTLVPPYKDTTCVVGFNILQPSCLQGGTCNQADLLQPNHQMNALGINPDLMQTGISNTFTLLNSDTVCWRNIKIENISSSQPAITQADHVFMALVDSSMPYLSDWHYKKGTQTIFPQGNVFALTPALALGTSITGDLCARVASCPADTLSHQVQVHFGWNCTGYPQSPYDSTAVCEYGVLNLSYKKATTQFYSSGKSFETPYTLCDTTTVSATFYSTQLGYVYPDSLLLQNLNPSLMVAGVTISANGNTAQLLPTLQPWLWLFAADSMAKIGFNEGGFNNGSQFILQVDLVAGCSFSGDTTLPDFNIYAHDYCGNAVDANADYRVSPVFLMSTVQSQCPDCWSITKTTNTDTAAAFTDTVTYTITVCNNSVNTQTGILSDITPPGFVTTSTTLPPTVTLNSMECDTFTVSGYFTSPGSCFYNVASVTSPIGTTWQDSVCVSVVNVCNVPNAITLPDSSFSLPLNNSYSNSNFVLQGRFYVNDTLVLTNCAVYAYPAAQIIVLTGGALILQGTSITACTQMWKGIMLNDKSRLVMTEQSLVADADIGIQAMNSSSFFLLGSRVIDCVRSIYVPQQSNGLNNIQGYVNDCSFGLYAAAFKPDYAGQPPHHAMPRACMEFNDVVMTIGDKDTNEFRNSNWGIYSLRSDLTVKTCRFRNMVAAGSLYGTATHKGTAVVAESKTAATAGMITFTNSSIDSCVYGTYTEWTTARVYSINAAHVSAVGSYHLYCNSTGMSTTVNNCNITAGKAGITFQNSERGTMTAAGNAIKVTAGGSSVGINIISTTTNFGNYQIMNNPSIEAVNGSGIVANSAKNVNVINNFVKLSGNTKNGIELTGCDTSTVSCNVVSGRYPAQTYQNKGIYSRFNNECYFGCNFTDSTRTGVFFSGSNSGTKFRGNEIKRHNIGLVLDSSAVIDTQAHAGNIWTSIYTSGYGAWNDNWFPTANLFKSLFLVDTTLGLTYTPIIPIVGFGGIPDDNGWFKHHTSDNTFRCDEYLLCYDNPAERGGGSMELKEAIAADSIISSAFVPESKMIAQMDLFKELKEDSVLRSSKTVFENFVSDKENQPIGYLYKVKAKLKELGVYSQPQTTVILTADSLIKVYLDEIRALDSIAATDSTVDNLHTRELLMSNIQLETSTKENIINQVGSSDVSKINQAANFNSLVLANGLPDENMKVINHINFIYLLYGKDTLNAYYSQIFSVAEQCPLTGGKAVYVARALMSLSNDTLIYEDNCTQNVNYRIQGEQETDNKIKNEIDVIPNPANNYTDVVLNESFDGICLIKITDVYSKPVFEQSFDCSKNQYRINTSDFVSGIYHVQIFVNDNTLKITKIIIVR